MTQQTMGQADAKEFFTLWERLTNRMGSEDMTPHLVDMLNREHPTLRQQMVALLASLLNSINAVDGDARNEASNAFLSRFQEWLEDYSILYPNDRAIYISPKGEVRFPFI